jgi:hypothetical protein
MEPMANARTLASYGVPPGCKVMLCVAAAKLRSGKPGPESPYWN